MVCCQRDWEVAEREKMKDESSKLKNEGKKAKGKN
jgi:hypothetical protein